MENLYPIESLFGEAAFGIEHEKHETVLLSDSAIPDSEPAIEKCKRINEWH